jgi:predicted nuclease of predicted toxin-antitoxin system
MLCGRREFLPSGDDESVLALAFREGRVLLTEDTDFGKLTVQLGTPSKGVVRIVLKSVDKEARNARVASALLVLGDRVWNAITVIEPSRVRTRPLSDNE